MASSQKRTKTCDDGELIPLEPVLDDIYYQPIELVDVLVCSLGEKKKISSVLSYLSTEFPLGTLSHLRRVRAGSSKESPVQIAIGAKDEHDSAMLRDKLHTQCSSLSDLYVIKVPKVQPLTRVQYNECVQYWPVAFHEDKRIAKLLSGDFFSKDELLVWTSHMKEAIQCAEQATQHKQLPIGAVIVDPTTNTVVAKCHDCRHGDHPLHHATMVCVDLVAKAQGGGMWQYPDGRFYCADLETGGDKPEPYLCTGYDIYLTREPCIMCAMSLVHSRIQRVFYGSSYSEGALGSKYKLHVQKGLNHHYEVYKGLLKEKCDQLIATG